MTTLAQHATRILPIRSLYQSRRFSSLRRNYWLGISLLVLAAQPLLASTFYVGTCHAGAFSTISDAVAALPAGSIIDVCPGTYPEQVKIPQALTLRGIASGGSGQAIITVPASGLTTTSSIFFGPAVAPQLWVTAEGVNISNITVDGTGGGCPGGWLVGIFYQTGSSGTLNEATVRNQGGNGCGLGALAENGGGTSVPITIENSSVHNVDSEGIMAIGNLTAEIKGNSVNGPLVGILMLESSGDVTDNVVVGGRYGITEQGSSTSSVSSNTIVNAQNGIAVASEGKVSSNKILNSSTAGIDLLASGAAVESNIITSSAVGIEFNCTTNTVVHNTINDAATGLDQVPAAFNGSNLFDSVTTLRVAGGC